MDACSDLIGYLPQGTPHKRPYTGPMLYSSKITKEHQAFLWIGTYNRIQGAALFAVFLQCLLSLLNHPQVNHRTLHLKPHVNRHPSNYPNYLAIRSPGSCSQVVSFSLTYLEQTHNVIPKPSYRVPQNSYAQSVLTVQDS